MNVILTIALAETDAKIKEFSFIKNFFFIRFLIKTKDMGFVQDN